MAGFDVSDVAAHVGQGVQPVTSPMQTLEQFAGLQNSLNQNRMFQSNQVVGQLLQQSIDPATGQPDMNKFQALVARTPGAAVAAPEALSRSLEQAGQGISNQTHQQALQAKQYQTLQAALAQTQNDDQVPTIINQLANTGQITPDFAHNVAGGNVQGLTRADIHAMREQAIMAAGNAAELEARFGHITNVDTGGVIQPVVQNQNAEGGPTSQPIEGAGIAKTLSPSDKAAPVTVVGPGGIERRHTLGEFVNPDGSPAAGVAAPVVGNPYATAAATAVGSSMSGAANYVGADGATRQISRAAFVNPDGSFKPNVTDANGNAVTDTTGTLKVSLSPNDTAELATNATNQADRDVALQSAFEGSPQRLALIKDMLATQGDFRSGPGAAKWAGIVTEANRVLGTKYDNAPASAEQVFGKIAEQLSAGQRDTLGLPATNAGTQAAQLASPNTAYSPEANQQVLAQLAGNERLLQTKTQAWDAYKKHPGATYNGFIKQFNQKVDPRAFWEPYMTDQQRAAMMKGMSPNDMQNYQQRKDYTGRLTTKFGVDGN